MKAVSLSHWASIEPKLGKLSVWWVLQCEEEAACMGGVANMYCLALGHFCIESKPLPYPHDSLAFFPGHLGSNELREPGEVTFLHVSVRYTQV